MNEQQRRATVLEHLADGGVMVLPAAVHHLRNADTEYEYRQDSDFYWLTGFTEPEAVLVLAPHAKEPATLFLRPKDRTAEIWTGKRLGVDDAPGVLGVDAAYPIDEFEKRLPDLLVGAKQTYVRLGKDEAFDRKITAATTEARYRVRRGGVAPDAYIEPGVILHEMRVHKTEPELAVMRRAAEATRLGHIAGMRATRPGLPEYELEAIIEHAYYRAGAQAVAYSSIVAGGDNATILHYNTNRDTLRAGDLVLVDSGAEMDLYACDVTRTWPVDGRFTPEQKALYEIVLAAQLAGIDEVRTGRSMRAYHERAVRVLTEGLIDVGLIRDLSVDAAIETEAYRSYYMHNTGHFIGLDVHDVGKYKTPDDQWRAMEPGMVVTVEPGLYVHRDLDCDERFKGIGIRIEDDVLCTNGDPEVLTPGIPKTLDELASVVGADAVQGAGTR